MSRFLLQRLSRTRISSITSGLQSRSKATSSKPHSTPAADIPPPRLSYASLTDSLPDLIHNASIRAAPITSTQLESASSLASKRRASVTALNAARQSRSLVSDQVRDKVPGAREKASALKGELKTLEEEVSKVERELLELAVMIPNDTHPDVPVGPEEHAYEIERIGPIEGEDGSLVGVSDPNRDHLIVGRQLGIIDFESGRLVSGAGFYFLRNEGTILSHALVSYALDLALKAGFGAASCPDVVRTAVSNRCGFAPRVPEDGSPAPSSQNYHVQPPSEGSPPLVLAATAEIPLAGANLMRTFYPSELPQRTVGVGKAYRTEIGTTEARGLYRVHQFEKVELFVVCREEESEREMERLRVVQRGLVRGLGLGVRVLDMPTEELGAAAYRKYDMEAWMPGRGSWGEISSTSNCTDYQSRRLHITYQTPTPPTSPDSPASKSPVKPTTFAHTLNGTAAAIPRLIVALLENGVVFNNQSAVAPPSSEAEMTFEERLEQGYKAKAALKEKVEGSPVKDKSKRAPGKSGRVVKKSLLRDENGEVVGERKETLDDGLEIVKMRLPDVLQRFWIGPEMMGGVPIEWV